MLPCHTLEEGDKYIIVDTQGHLTLKLALANIRSTLTPNHALQSLQTCSIHHTCCRLQGTMQGNADTRVVTRGQGQLWD